MSNQIHTIRGAVYSVMNELELSNANKEYSRLEQIAIEGYRELIKFNGVSVEVAYLTMNDANIVTLPDDYERYLKVAIFMGGRLWTLTKDDTLPLPEGVVKCDTPLNMLTNDTSVDYGNFYFVAHQRGKDMVDGLYAQGGGLNVGYFRWDKRNNTLVFNATVPQSQIIVEYISNGLNVNGSSRVPGRFYETLKRWIHWKRIEYKRGYSATDRQWRLRLFEDARQVAILQDLASPIEEWMDNIASTTRQGIKR